MSILDKKNWDGFMHWYRVDDQIAWWDFRIKLWTTYMVDGAGTQNSAAEYYPNKKAFFEGECDGSIRIEKWDK